MPPVQPGRHFDVREVEARLSFLDACPESLLPAIVTLPVGDLADRTTAVLGWRDALLAGRTPSIGPPWPPEHLAGPVRLALAELGIARFCRGEPELVDRLLGDVLASLRQGQDRAIEAVRQELRRLEEFERARLAASRRKTRRKRCGGGRRADAELPGGAADAPPVVLDARTAARLEAMAREAVERAVAERPDAALLARWGDLVRVWAELAEVFGDLGNALGLGWDLGRGVLRQQGWHELLRLRALLETLPALRELVRTLGRLHRSEHGPSVLERITRPLRRTEEELRAVETPIVPAETRGVERSGAVSRMLPVEAVLLGHPKLRLLWHARRAERSLLTYRVQGVHYERVTAEVEDEVEEVRRTPRPERGPIVVVVDTSGSMSGLPEQVAKAVALESLRVAHAEGRTCYLYAFGGPGEVAEHELDLSPTGLGELLGFLTLSFHGGTDLREPVERVLGRLEMEGWQRADVLLVSDGEFPVEPDLARRVALAVGEGGNRVHGLLVGGGQATALGQLCDPLHTFGDWAALAHGTGGR